MITQESMYLIADFIANLTGIRAYVYSPTVTKSGYIYIVVPSQYVPETKAYAELMLGNPSIYAIIPSDSCFLRMTHVDTYISVVQSFNRTIKSGALSE